uniref:fibronectin type III domain-containing protein n=1 Tax=Psychroflexus aestuariivivens TaxID=1795040 RepID=UPI00130074FB
MKKILFFLFVVVQTSLIQAQQFTVQGGCNRTFTNLYGGLGDPSVDNFPIDFFNSFFAIGVVNYSNPTGGNIIIDYQNFNVPIAEQNNTIFVVYDGLNGTGNNIFEYNPSNSPSPGDQLTINSSTASIVYLPVSPSNLLTEDRQIRFNVTCEAPITCESPQNLEIQNLTTSSFDASWNSVSNATEGYVYVLMNGNQAPDVATAVASGTTTNTEQSFSGLSPGADYSLYVRADCGLTDGLSSWLSKSFNVPNQILQPPFNTNNWIEVRRFVSPQGEVSINTYSMSNQLTLVDNVPTGIEVIAASPPIQISPNSYGEIQLNPSNFSTFTPNTRFEIRISTQTRNFEDFTIVHNSQTLLSNGTEMSVPNINLSDYAGQTIYIGYSLKKINNNTQSHSILVGNLVSSCPQFTTQLSVVSGNVVRNNNLLLNNRASNSATVSWQVPTGEQSTLIDYQYVLMPRGETLDVDNAIAVGVTNNTSFQFTGLDENTLYDAYVRTTCDGGQQFFGSTTERLTFSTLPETLVTCNETLTSPIYNSIANYIPRDETTTFVAADTGKMLKVEFEEGNIPDLITISLLNGDSNSAPSLATISNNQNLPSVGTFYANNAEASLSIRAQNSSFVTNGTSINYKLRVSCYDCSETPNNLVTAEIKDITAKLSWEEPEVTLNGYDVLVMPQGETPVEANAEFFANVNNNEATLTSLTQDTQYTVYVRANCQPNLANSEWVSVDFTTDKTGNLCEYPINILDFPFTTSNNTTGFTANYSSSDLPSLANAVQSNGLAESGFISGKEIVYNITPENNAFYNIHLNNVTANTGLMVLQGCAPFTEVVAYDFQEAAGSRSFELLPLLEEGTYYIVISGNDVNHSTSFDLNIEKFTCLPVTNLSLNEASAVTASFSWTNPLTSTENINYALFLQGENPSAATPQQTGSLAANLTSISLESLSDETDYQLYFTTDCGSSLGESESVSVTFTTQAFTVPEVEVLPVLVDVNSVPFNLNENLLSFHVEEETGNISTSFSENITCSNASFVSNPQNIGNSASTANTTAESYQSFQAPSNGFIIHLSVLVEEVSIATTASFEVYKNQFSTSSQGTGITKIGEASLDVMANSTVLTTTKFNKPIYVEADEVYLLKQVSGPQVLLANNSTYAQGETLSIADENLHFIEAANLATADDWVFDLRFFDVSSLTPQSINFNVSNVAGTTTEILDVYSFSTSDLTLNTQNATVNLNANGNASISVNDIDENSATLCNLPLIQTLSNTNFSCEDVGVNQITYSVTDQFGNTEEVIVEVDVLDNSAVVLQTNLSNITDYTLDENGKEITYSLPNVQDNCINNGIAISLDNFPPTPTNFTKLGTFEGHTYFYSDQGFEDIQDHLDIIENIPDAYAVAVNSEAENTFLSNKMDEFGLNNILLGAIRVSPTEFEWINGETFDYTNWSQNEPNNFNGVEDKVELLNTGLWNDAGATPMSRKIIIEIPYAIEQTSGLANGENFSPGVTTNSFTVYDKSGNTEDFSFDVNIRQADYIYVNNAWFENVNPNGNANSTETMLVVDHSAILSTPMSLAEITIDNNAVLEINDVLSVAVSITNNGQIIFKSNQNSTGQLDEFTGNVSGSGDITVERYFPANRSFRFVTSAVDSDANIYTNWQENGA